MEWLAPYQTIVHEARQQAITPKLITYVYPFKDIAKDMGWFATCKKKTLGCITHNLYDKGVLSVPREQRGLFCVAMGHALTNRIPCYVTEALSQDLFCWFADFDLKWECPEQQGGKEAWQQPTSCLHQIVTIVMKTLMQSFPQKTFHLIICLSASHQGKTGVHLYSPDLIFENVDICYWIRTRTIATLREKLGLPKDPGNCWEDRFDERVYHPKNGSLRLVGNDKANECTKCAASKSNKRSKSSSFCSIPDCHQGIIPANKIYQISAVWKSDNQMIQEDDNSLKLLQEDYALQLVVTSLLPLTQTMATSLVLPSTIIRNHKKRKITTSPHKLTAVTSKILPMNHPLIELLTEFIRNWNTKCWGQVRIKKITSRKGKDGEPGSLFLQVEGPGHKYCLNKGGEHSSSCIYFVVASGVIRQFCFSQTDVVRQAGGFVCSQFKSSPHVLSLQIIAAMNYQEKNHHGLTLAEQQKARQVFETGTKGASSAPPTNFTSRECVLGLLKLAEQYKRIKR